MRGVKEIRQPLMGGGVIKINIIISLSIVVKKSIVLHVPK